MAILFWVIFGAIAGWIASLLVGQRGQGCVVNIALGIVGAMVGGALFRALGTRVYWSFNVESLIVAVLGAVIVLFLYHAATGRRRW